MKYRDIIPPPPRGTVSSWEKALDTARRLEMATKKSTTAKKSTAAKQNAKEVSITTYDWGRNIYDIGFDGMLEKDSLHSLADAMEEMETQLFEQFFGDDTVSLYKIVATHVGTYKLGGLTKIK